ncbi:MAG: hypothetical protein AAGE61_10305 [Pseudomonadota bacterium]
MAAEKDNLRPVRYLRAGNIETLGGIADTADLALKGAAPALRRAFVHTTLQTNGVAIRVNAKIRVKGLERRMDHVGMGLACGQTVETKDKC